MDIADLYERVARGMTEGQREMLNHLLNEFMEAGKYGIPFTDFLSEATAIDDAMDFFPAHASVAQADGVPS